MFLCGLETRSDPPDKIVRTTDESDHQNDERTPPARGRGCTSPHGTSPPPFPIRRIDTGGWTLSGFSRYGIPAMCDGFTLPVIARRRCPRRDLRLYRSRRGRRSCCARSRDRVHRSGVSELCHRHHRRQTWVANDNDRTRSPRGLDLREGRSAGATGCRTGVPVSAKSPAGSDPVTCASTCPRRPYLPLAPGGAPTIVSA